MFIRKSSRKRPSAPVRAALLEPLEGRLLLAGGPGVTDVKLMRTISDLYSDTNSEPSTYTYELNAGGNALTDIAVTTPWGDAFDAASILPAGWAGEDFTNTAGNMTLNAYTDAGGKIWFELDWADIGSTDFATLGTTGSAVTVSYTGGTWAQTPDFSTAPLPAAFPALSTPLDAQGDVMLQPTFSWLPWAGAPATGGGTSLEVDDPNGTAVIDQPTLPAGATWSAAFVLNDA